MNTRCRTWTALASSVLALILTAVRPAAQAPAMAIAPQHPAILVGQTQQFSASGVSVPVAIAGGGYHTCLLMSDQSIRCFGENNWGQLGNGSFANSSTPLAVSGVATAVAATAGIEHTCALLADGAVKCWGTNFVGQLGDGTFGGMSAVPKAVPGLANVIGLVAGGFHNCALLSDRTVKCWGRNQDGQIGNGDSTTDVSPPSQAVAGLGAAAAVSAGGYHSCALLPDATVRCWGRNARGQLGDGTTVPSSTPVTVSGLTTAVAVTGGLYHTCALLRDGTVQCWGENDSGQIGNTQPFSSVPVTVNGIANAVAVSAGVFHTCALLSDGTARCWGQNGNGQLGNGTTTNSSSPVAVNGLSGASVIGGAGLHSCALMPDGGARCWGFNAYGQLGNGSNVDSPSQVSVIGTGLTWSSSNPSVATIDAGGRAAGVARGSTTIAAVDSSGNSANTTLSVHDLLTLTVTPQGDGAGTVTSAPAGISCGSACSASFASDAQVTLTATAGSGSMFIGWSGCDAASSTTCTVTMNATRSVGARFDLQRFTLAVSKSGTGGGDVTSSPAGISCGPQCAASYASGTSVTLTAAPASGSVLTGWTGCASVSGSTCTVTMNAARSVVAAFDLTRADLSVIKAGSGTGTVTSSPAGISCGADCSESYDSGTQVTLAAVAGSGALFTGWTGCTAVSGLTCTVAMNGAKSITATFSVQRFTLAVAKAGAGNGTVTSAPAGITCGADCSEPYDSGTTVTLTAGPAAGSLFGAWNGCAAVSGASCTVSMNTAHSVTATFNVQFFTLTVSKTGLGGGTVTSTPAGITCGSACSASYASDTVVTLTASPNLLSGFTGWSGCDTVSGTTCTVRTSRVRTVIAAFRVLGLI